MEQYVSPMSENTTFDPAQLKARFNPEGSLLCRHQQRMKEMLQVLDAICSRHGIPYWISSGTLIGCVRHGGFIPWDDDLDVEMLMPDYERLLRVLPRELPSWMALQHHATDPHYFYSYAKLRDRHSFLSEECGYDRVFRFRGIYIDIMPQAPCPLWLHKRSCLSLGHVYKQLRQPGLGQRRACRIADFWYALNHGLVYPLLRMAARCCPSAPLRHALGVPFHSTCSREEIFPLGRARFEDIEVSVPHDPDAYLRRKYGNYMRLPDLDVLQPHVCEIEFGDGVGEDQKSEG